MNFSSAELEIYTTTTISVVIDGLSEENIVKGGVSRKEEECVFDSSAQNKYFLFVSFNATV